MTTRAERLARSRVLRALEPHALNDTDLAHGPLELFWQSTAGGQVGGTQYVRGDELLSFSVRRGREGANEQSQAGTLRFSLAVANQGDLNRIAVGDKVTFQTRIAAGKYLLDDPPGPPYYGSQEYSNGFTAWVVDLALEFRSQGQGRPPQAVMAVTCSGPKLRAGQGILRDDSPYQPLPYWWTESLSSRRGRIEVATREALWGGDPVMGSWLGDYYIDQDVPVNPLNVTEANVLQTMESYAADVGANFTESIRHPGRLMWESIVVRAGKDPLVQLTPDEVAATASWAQSLNGLVNVYTVEYGPPEARESVTVKDAESIALYGEYAATRSSSLVNRSDAERLAGLIVGRNSRPSWTISRLDVDLLDLALPKAKAAALYLQADVGTLIELTGLPTAAPQQRYFFVEGSEVTLTKHDWRMTIYVSDADRTGAPLEWEEVQAGLTWADVEATRTWLGAAGWFTPPPETFRWVDVAANLSWTALAANNTWDGSDAVPTWASFPDNPTP